MAATDPPGAINDPHAVNRPCSAGGASLSSVTRISPGERSPNVCSGWTRLLLGLAGAGIIVLLAVAFTLKPSPSGYGTHQRLGLPPCTFYTLAGVRCPACGMTTSWAYLTQGKLTAAVAANSGGALLGLVCIGVAPWMLVSALKGRWLWGFPPDWLSLLVVGTIIGVTLVDWTYRLLIY